MNSWQEVSIGDVAEVFDGPHATPKTVDAGPVFLGIDALQNGRLVLGKTRHVTPADFEKWTKRVTPRAGDVVFSYETRLGEAAIIPEGLKCCLGRRMGLVRVDQARVLPEFFLYQYISPTYQRFLASRTIPGATVDRIALKEFPSFPLSLPPLPVQKGILQVLQSLDDKIELNQRMNETLEEMARALFRDWFVDFGPTRRQMEGATDPVAIMGGAFPAEKAATLAPLFPAALGEDGLPEGWATGEVADLANLNPKSWTAKKHPQNVEYVDLSNTKWGRIEDTTNFEWTEAPSRARRALEIGDTIVGTVRPGNGSYSLVGRGGLTGSTGFAVLRPKQANAVEFVYCALTSPENIESLANLADGGAYPAINPKVVAATGITLADQGVMSVFSEVTRSMFAKRHANEQESQILAEMRDLLLPKLMSGEIRVGNVEAAG